ncbi:iron-containing redox enzyme family protein [Actinomadura harenae]|uniref:Iron-containing redox enzyme family protein n=1 Tax=Actinomadura harenae TaxID=2483351 RepID=A0A3M2MFN5_9ACTN|nr:iron-containing redox enzyme family protein [Actinomadura harenae]RMI47445.1 iron-containing redox enzyme family protein [Actinomadura harenae]
MTELDDYQALPIFRPGPEVYLDANPYRRPIALPDAGDFTEPVTEAEFLSRRHLLASRVLCNAYESEMILLPEDGVGPVKSDFDLFYGPEVRRLHDGLRPSLERYSFTFLERFPAPEVRTVEELEAYFLGEVEDAGAPPDASGNNPAVNVLPRLTGSMAAITECPDAEDAARLNLIQLSLDGLTEASAMAGNLAGFYGPEQSELFKVFTDEFGYGLYNAKHSTLFREMIASIGLRTDVHAYWNFYLTSSLAGANYFNYLTKNHRGVFRYMAAVSYLEWLFAQGFADMGRMLRAVFGDRADTRYTDEHAHIDIHHGRMTFENLLLGLARRHGEAVVPDLVRGIVETKELLRLGDEDFQAQIAWASSLEEHTRLGTKLATSADDDGTVTGLRPGDPFSTVVHDGDRLVEVTAGEVAVHAWATEGPHRMDEGETLLVPAGRLYGLRAVSPKAEIAVRPTTR